MSGFIHVCGGWMDWTHHIIGGWTDGRVGGGSGMDGLDDWTNREYGRVYDG